MYKERRKKARSEFHNDPDVLKKAKVWNTVDRKEKLYNKTASPNKTVKAFYEGAKRAQEWDYNRAVAAANTRYKNTMKKVRAEYKTNKKKIKQGDYETILKGKKVLGK